MTNHHFAVSAFALALASAPVFAADATPRSRLAAQVDRCLMISDRKEECFSDIERHALVLSGKSVGRQGSTLEVRVNSEVVRLVDAPESDQEGTGHTYLGSVGNPPYHLIMVRAWENVGYRLISPQSGKQFEFPALPEPSPSGSRIAVVAADEMNDVSEVAVWKILPDRMVQEFRHAWNAGQPYVLFDFGSWHGETKVRLARTTYDEAKRCSGKTLITVPVDLEWVAGAWRLSDTPAAAFRCQ